MAWLKSKLLRVLFFLAPAFVMAGLVFFHKRDSHFGTKEEFVFWAAQDVRAWEKKNYVPLKKRDAFESAISHLQIGGSPLNPEMHKAYLEALNVFFHAYDEGGIEAWKQFRFYGSQREEMTSNGVFHVEFFYGLAKLPQPAFPDFAPDDNNFLRKWKDEVKTNSPPQVKNTNDLKNLFSNYLSAITYGDVYKKYFQGVCFDEIIAKHEVYTALPETLDKYPFFPFQILRGHAMDATFPNIGYWRFDNGNPQLSFFTTHPTVRELLSEYQSVDCINTFVYVRINERGKVSPFLLRHVWNPKTEKWMPVEFVDGHILPDRLLHMIF